MCSTQHYCDVGKSCFWLLQLDFSQAHRGQSNLESYLHSNFRPLRTKQLGSSKVLFCDPADFKQILSLLLTLGCVRKFFSKTQTFMKFLEKELFSSCQHKCYSLRLRTVSVPQNTMWVQRNQVSVFLVQGPFHCVHKSRIRLYSDHESFASHPLPQRQRFYFLSLIFYNSLQVQKDSLRTGFSLKLK